MADSAKSVKTDTPKERVKKYPLNSFLKSCKTLFGVSKSTFVGATSSLAYGEYTIEEIKKHMVKKGG